MLTGMNRKASKAGMTAGKFELIPHSTLTVGLLLCPTAHNGQIFPAPIRLMSVNARHQSLN